MWLELQIIYLNELSWYLPTRRDKILKEDSKCGADNKSTNTYDSFKSPLQLSMLNDNNIII
jgi:hypothetical protein